MSLNELLLSRSRQRSLRPIKALTVELVKEAAVEQTGDLEAIRTVAVNEEVEEPAEVCVEGVVEAVEVSAPIKLNALS